MPLITLGHMRTLMQKLMLRPLQQMATDGIGKVITAILQSPGPIVSFSILVKKGVFRRCHANNIANKELMLKAVNKLSQLHFGQIENFTITSNNSKVGKTKGT